MGRVSKMPPGFGVMGMVFDLAEREARARGLRGKAIDNSEEMRDATEYVHKWLMRYFKRKEEGWYDEK